MGCSVIDVLPGIRHRCPCLHQQAGRPQTLPLQLCCAGALRRQTATNCSAAASVLRQPPKAKHRNSVPAWQQTQDFKQEAEDHQLLMQQQQLQWSCWHVKTCQKSASIVLRSYLSCACMQHRCSTPLLQHSLHLGVPRHTGSADHTQHSSEHAKMRAQH
jgi:hypothetical protein